MIDFSTRNAEFLQVLRLAERAAQSSANVLIAGESGTGKTRLARWLHERSPRRDGPFVAIHCANVPAGLVDSDLFGHEAGAFTDAHARRTGRFEQAVGGTLFLDEVHELDVSIQGKVLRAVQERRIDRVGGVEPVEVDVRIFASTADEPEAVVAAGRLRGDLFYRLDVVRLRLPALRARRDDIALLAGELLGEAVATHRLGPRRFAPDVLRRLEDHDWAGNVRELGHVVESAAILAEGPEITAADLPESLATGSRSMLRAAAAAGRTLADVESAYIDEVLRRTRGNKSAAAQILGIHRKTLHEKLRARKTGDGGR